MANKFIGETSGKYWKQKNDETYVSEEELVKITDLEESTTVDDDDLLIQGNPSTGKMLRIKVANFLDGIKEKLLGNTDISSVGDGTVTGAISENAENISANKDDADSKYNELNSALANRYKTIGSYAFTSSTSFTFDSDQRVIGDITYPSEVTEHDFYVPIFARAGNGYITCNLTNRTNTTCTIQLVDIRGTSTSTVTPVVFVLYADK